MMPSCRSPNLFDSIYIYNWADTPLFTLYTHVADLDTFTNSFLYPFFCVCVPKFVDLLKPKQEFHLA